MFNTSAVSSMKLKLLNLKHSGNFTKLNATVCVAEVAEILQRQRHRWWSPNS